MFDCSSTCGHRDIHVLAHSFPARRSSDLPCPVGLLRWSPRWNSPPRQRPPPSFRAARRRMSDLPIAGFDSASAFLRATANYVRGKDFPALGLNPATARIAPLANLLPTRLREMVYTYGGLTEAAAPEDRKSTRLNSSH